MANSSRTKESNSTGAQANQLSLNETKELGDTRISLSLKTVVGILLTLGTFAFYISWQVNKAADKVQSVEDRLDSFPTRLEVQNMILQHVAERHSFFVIDSNQKHQ